MNHANKSEIRSRKFCRYCSIAQQETDDPSTFQRVGFMFQAEETFHSDAIRSRLGREVVGWLVGEQVS